MLVPPGGGNHEDIEVVALDHHLLAGRLLAPDLDRHDAVVHPFDDPLVDLLLVGLDAERERELLRCRDEVRDERLALVAFDVLEEQGGAPALERARRDGADLELEVDLLSYALEEALRLQEVHVLPHVLVRNSAGDVCHAALLWC